ncbi:MAG: helix-turn-helix transcriptional regulator [Alphaproteobacteria bacterium]|nr:helix-turn-helix transcriptional regulator [Alphaproteobacteria bacterium]
MTHIQIITEKGRKMAVLPLSAYKRMVSALEDKEDARDIREAKAVMARVKAGQESLIPGDVAHAILDGVHPVRAWRDAKGMTAQALATKAGISRAYLTQIERGSRKGTVAVMRALAKALGIGVDALID